MEFLYFLGEIHLDPLRAHGPSKGTGAESGLSRCGADRGLEVDRTIVSLRRGYRRPSAAGAGFDRVVALVNAVAEAALPVIERFFWAAWLFVLVRALAGR